MPVTPREAAHYRVLRLIEEQPEISQRELARVLGVSLGKTHYLLKALLDKGLVKADNFRRSDNKLAYAYLLKSRRAGVTFGAYLRGRAVQSRSGVW